MKKRMAIMLILCLIVFGGLVGFYFFKQAFMKKIFAKFANPSATVTTAVVKMGDWQPYLQAVGTLHASKTVDLLPQSGGEITGIYFTSGQMVRKGQLLISLDNSSQLAQLHADMAQLKLKQLTYARNLRLFKQKAISSAELDSAKYMLQAQLAAVASDKALLNKLQMRAPFSGKLGISTATVGQYVAPPPAGSKVVTLSAIDPVTVQFEMPQQALPNLHIGQAIELRVDAFPGKVFAGKIDAMNPGVDATSRTLLIQAAVDNRSRQLVPGMFTNIRIMLPVQHNVVNVLQTAIVYSLYGDSVYVVNKDKTVTQRFVTVGQAHGIEMVIKKGLKAGETVVTSGQLKLHNGMKITVNNKVLPN